MALKVVNIRMAKDCKGLEVVLEIDGIQRRYSLIIKCRSGFTILESFGVPRLDGEQELLRSGVDPRILRNAIAAILRGEDVQFPIDLTENPQLP